MMIWKNKKKGIHILAAIKWIRGVRWSETFGDVRERERKEHFHICIFDFKLSIYIQQHSFDDKNFSLKFFPLSLSFFLESIFIHKKMLFPSGYISPPSPIYFFFFFLFYCHAHSTLLLFPHFWPQKNDFFRCELWAHQNEWWHSSFPLVYEYYLIFRFC